MNVINEFKKQSYRNAVRLFGDSCILALNNRYQTAYAIAILAYEEIGKSAIADRQLDMVCMNPGSEDLAREWLIKFIKIHNIKQQWAHFETNLEMNSFEKNLDFKKQRALYVDYDGNRVVTPHIKLTELKAMIEKVYRALNDICNLPYSGIDGWSTNGEWQAQLDIKSVQNLYDSVCCL